MPTLQKTYENEIAEITEKIIKGYNPEKIILFGSAAKGELRKDSDADFFIIKDTEERFFNRCRAVRRLIRGREIPVDIIVYSPKEVNHALEIGSFFTEDIIKNGKVLYEKERSSKSLVEKS